MLRIAIRSDFIHAGFADEAIRNIVKALFAPQKVFVMPHHRDAATFFKTH
jgi:hypothetical protein